MAAIAHDEFYSIDQILMEENNMDHSEATNMDETQHNDSNSTEHEEGFQEPKGRKQLTVFQKRELVDAYLLKLEGGELPRGYVSQQAKKFNVHRSTILRLFTDIKAQLEKGNVIDVRSKKVGKTGPKPREYTDEFLQSAPLYKRGTERSCSQHLTCHHT